jgi:hypothetical protein
MMAPRFVVSRHQARGCSISQSGLERGVTDLKPLGVPVIEVCQLSVSLIFTVAYSGVRFSGVRFSGVRLSGVRRSGIRHLALSVDAMGFAGAWFACLAVSSASLVFVTAPADRFVRWVLLATALSNTFTPEG